MKILVPTDFSKLSKVAIHYAAQMAKKINAEIVLFHVVFLDAPPRAQLALKTDQILDLMVDNAKQDCVHLINEIKQEHGDKTEISYKIIKGYPVEDVVGAFAHNNHIDLIIMGTKGASGLKKVLLGSNTNAVISNLDIPVIAVPEHARFGNMMHIVYASDLHAIEKEMEAVIDFAKPFDSHIYILHVIPPNSKKKIDTIKIKNNLIQKYQYDHISAHISLNEHLEEAIDEYLADIKADLLAMFTHKPSFFEKLFGESVTREMAFQNWIPLLAIKK